MPVSILASEIESRRGTSEGKATTRKTAPTEHH
jgi:hypothetical protein